VSGLAQPGTNLSSVIDVRHFSDPGCPWAWSASPALSVLHWRYGDQLRWRLVMIGLTEHGGEYASRGYTGERMARGYRSFRHRGMPFQVEPRDHIHGIWPMCRAVVAARLTAPDRAWAVFRALMCLKPVALWLGAKTHRLRTAPAPRYGFSSNTVREPRPVPALVKRGPTTLPQESLT